MKKLMFALACAASAAVMGTDTLNNKATFEAFAVGTKAEALVNTDDSNNNAENSSTFWELALASDTAADASEVTAYETAPADDNSNYLRLETNGDELRRKVQANGAAATVGNGLYIDTLVQFTATPDSSSVSIDAGAKLAIWLEGEETYTLKVAGGFMDATSNTSDGDLIFEQPESAYALAGNYSSNTWYRLTVQAISDLTDLDEDEVVVSGFVIKINGAVVKTTSQVYTQTALEYLCPSQIPDTSTGTEDDWLSANNLALLKDGSFIPSAVQQNFALTSVGFQGSGAIDTVTITDEDPWGEVTPAEFTLTINFGDGVSAVSYTVGDATAVPVTKNGTEVPGIASGETVSITVTEVADWFVAPAKTTFEMTESTNVTVTATEVVVDENTTATSLGITTGGFANADATALAPVVTWAKENKISVSTINGMFISDALTYNEKGYLFNMDPADTDAIDEEEEDFKVTAISYNAETGKWEVEDNGKDTWNGKVEIRGAESLTNPTWSKGNEAGPFFKAFLTK